MRAVARSGDGAGRLGVVRKQGTAVKPQTGDAIYPAGVWARATQERRIFRSRSAPACPALMVIDEAAVPSIIRFDLRLRIVRSPGPDFNWGAFASDLEFFHQPTSFPPDATAGGAPSCRAWVTLQVMIRSIPFNEPANAFINRRLRSEIDLARQIIDIGVSCGYVAWLHR